jgi:carboxypeptidase family protein
MRFTLLVMCSFVLVWNVSAQTANGTITGTVTDQTGGVVPNAAVQVRNTDTGVVYQSVSTTTGNYTAAQLPVGKYEVSVTVQGFKKYDRQGLDLAAAQIMRIDIPLEVGSTSDVLTVSAEASLLKTESGDVTHNITIDNLTNLPILGIGGNNTGSSGIRNPYNSTVMIPGVRYVVNNTLVVNGANTNSESIRIEGQDATNHTLNEFSMQQNQPSADSIEEVAVQTSNYAAEFGTAGSGVFNITMKSGTNQFHGSA